MLNRTGPSAISISQDENEKISSELQLSAQNKEQLKWISYQDSVLPSTSTT
jgi:DNA-directed RNA polymerase subunit H (RpoH/RPB5)